jgi:two-component system response regulator FlrC
MNLPAVLCVEDELQLLDDLVDILRHVGYDCIPATCGEEALRLLANSTFGVVLCDIQLPGIDGFETLQLANQRELSSPESWILMTAYSDSEIFNKVAIMTDVELLLKPIDFEKLLTVIARRLGSGPR